MGNHKKHSESDIFNHIIEYERDNALCEFNYRISYVISSIEGGLNE